MPIRTNVAHFHVSGLSIGSIVTVSLVNTLKIK